MPTRPDAAAKAAMALYADAPRADRAHVRGRWWTAPFTAVEKSLPTTGRVLEVGCGHGLFVAYAALTGPQRIVVGVDIDTDKIAVGTRALAPLGERATVSVGVSGRVPEGPWDAIVILDVLYLLPSAEQHALIDRCVAALAPGGRLLVKEMDMAAGWKARWNTAQETLAVKVLRITEGHEFDFLPTANDGAVAARSGPARDHGPLGPRLPSPACAPARRPGGLTRTPRPAAADDEGPTPCWCGALVGRA